MRARIAELAARQAERRAQQADRLTYGSAPSIQLRKLGFDTAVNEPFEVKCKFPSTCSFAYMLHCNFETTCERICMNDNLHAKKQVYMERPG